MYLHRGFPVCRFNTVAFLTRIAILLGLNVNDLTFLLSWKLSFAGKIMKVFFSVQTVWYEVKTGGRLTKNHLIKIVFFQLIEIFIISWPKFWTLFSWSKVLIMSSIKRLKISQLIELFDQLPKKNWRILAVDQIFFKA